MRSEIIKETPNYIVLHKPAGFATQTAGLGEPDLVSEVKNYMSDKNGNRNPYIAVINRLDQPVEGLVLVAKDEKTAAEFSRQLNNGDIEKYYQAVVFGHMPDKCGRLEDYLIKDGKANLSRVSRETDKQAKKAVLEYTVIKSTKDTDTLDIRLITGRHHQIRVQLAHAGCPLLGDKKYGNELSVRFGDDTHIGNICLKAYKMIFKDIVSGDRITCSLL